MLQWTCETRAELYAGFKILTTMSQSEWDTALFFSLCVRLYCEGEQNIMTDNYKNKWNYKFPNSAKTCDMKASFLVYLWQSVPDLNLLSSVAKKKKRCMLASAQITGRNPFLSWLKIWQTADYFFLSQCLVSDLMVMLQCLKLWNNVRVIKTNICCTFRILTIKEI